ncbi:type II toxin-antitoxin system PemK/MazF family toxin [Nitratifractor sp.]
MKIRQGEIWLVNLDPTIGSEINKKRPCLVVSDDTIGKLPSKTVVPITGWNELYAQVPWMIRCEPDNDNGLSKCSSIDAFQIRNLSTRRFIHRIGSIDNDLLHKVHSAIVKTLSVRYSITYP